MSGPKTTIPEQGIIRPELRGNLAQVRELCTDCGLCREECGFLQRYGTPGQIAQDYAPAHDKWLRTPFACSLCKLCQAVCPAGLKPDALFLEMRREAVERGTGPFPEHARRLAYERTGMSRRFTLYALPEGCTSVLFPGCAFPGSRPARTKLVFEILRRHDPKLGIVLDCCGRISQDLGREAFTRAMFAEMQIWLTDHGVREVILICPNCYDMFREYGAGLSVRMIYEVLPVAEMAAPRGQAKIILHDPCGTRFHASCQNAVRDLLAAAGIVPQDMDQTRAMTVCCGSGAGVEALEPDLARQWLERATSHVQGRTLATYCAGCAQKLDTRTQTVHVLDLLCAPTAALYGKRLASRAPLSYLNRMLLKGHFKKSVPHAAVRERTFWAGDKSRGTLGRLLILAAIIAAIILARLTGLTDFLDQERLRGLIQPAGALAPLIYVLVYTLAPSLFMPGLPLTIVGGILFGPFWGVVYAITGATAGACLAFLIARYAARDWVHGKLKSPRLQILDEDVKQQGWKIVAFTRLIPLFPFNLLNYAFGLTKIGFIPYAVTSFFCMLPACIAYVVFSSSLIDLLKGRVSVNLLIGTLLIALVALIPVGYRIYHRQP